MASRAQVVQLSLRERVRSDPAPLISIYRTLGAEPGADLINHALDDLGRIVQELRDDLPVRIGADRTEGWRPRLLRLAEMA